MIPVVATALLGVTGVTACSSENDGTASSTQSPALVRPAPPTDRNAIVVVVDDATDISCSNVQRFMPKTAQVLRNRGTCFDNATVTSPACAPSRATLMTSQMPHNNRVVTQVDAARLRAGETVQADLTDAGYDTYGTGKFFNGVSPWLVESGEKGSGFVSSDFWAGSEYYTYKLWNDKTKRPERPNDRVHATTRTGMFLRSFIEKQADSGRPFYAYAAFKAPHTDNSATNAKDRLPVATPANANRAVPPFRFDPELDRRDKLATFQGKIGTRRYYERLYTARTRALYDVDDEMGKTFDVLRRDGLLDTTAIIFTSDNGYHLGENGWETKGDPYPASMNTPMLAYLPGSFAAGRTDRRPVGVVDIAPTIYQLLGVKPGHRVDGRSLLSKQRRGSTFHQMVNEKKRTPAIRARGGFFPARVPSWAMWRNGNRAYVEYYRHNGSLLRAEFYRDAAMKRNLLWPGYRAERPSQKVISQFRYKLRQAKRCSGTREQGSSNPCP